MEERTWEDAQPRADDHEFERPAKAPKPDACNLPFASIFGPLCRDGIAPEKAATEPDACDLPFASIFGPLCRDVIRSRKAAASPSRSGKEVARKVEDLVGAAASPSRNTSKEVARAKLVDDLLKAMLQ